MNPLQLMAEGGWSTWLILLLSLIAHPLAIAAVVQAFAKKQRSAGLGLGVAAAALAAVTLLVGLVGRRRRA